MLLADLRVNPRCDSEVCHLGALAAFNVQYYNRTSLSFPWYHNTSYSWFLSWNTAYTIYIYIIIYVYYIYRYTLIWLYIYIIWPNTKTVPASLIRQRPSGISFKRFPHVNLGAKGLLPAAAGIHQHHMRVVLLAWMVDETRTGIWLES